MKLTVFGGSTASGLGVKDRSFGALVAERLGLELNNLAGSSAQITDSLAIVDQAANSQVVIVMHGSGEGLIRPSDGALRPMPPRWRRRGWMDPRAYFSSKWYKRWPQKLESALRWRMKVFLIRHVGRMHILPLERYVDELAQFDERLTELGIPLVVYLGTAGSDPRYFPFSNEHIAPYDEATRALAENRGRVFLDIEYTAHHWDGYFLDHLHPNVAGHADIADQIHAAIVNAMLAEDRVASAG